GSTARRLWRWGVVSTDRSQARCSTTGAARPPGCQDFLATAFLVVFFAADFLAGAFLAPFLVAFFAGPFSRRSARSSAARSRVMSKSCCSFSSDRESVPFFRYGP